MPHFVSKYLFPTCAALSLMGCEAVTNVKSASAPKPVSENFAKNIILFIGDGMGVSTVTAARIFDGQSQGLKGEEHSLAFEDFENLALIKTYNVNAQVPDSAGTATAMLSGYKANIGAINVEPGFELQGCGDIPAKPTLTARSQAAGKSVGIISTARITHATPAAMYAYADDRGWEADRDLPEKIAPFGCKSIAQHMVDSPAEVILGGGRKEFTDAQKDTLKDGYIYVENKTDLMNSKAGKIRGLFTDSHMNFEADRDPALEPSLAEMTAAALETLSLDPDGFVLMVEAGRVDHAHHGTNAYRALTDMQALNEAVKVAKAKTGKDTLIMVTADHSHVFTMAGYPVRGNPILGLVRGFDPKTGTAGEYVLAEDGKPYTTLGYHNGPNIREADSPALTDNMVQAKNFRQQTAVHTSSETHAGEDVPLYATGPGSGNVRGVMEQNEVYTVMAKAMGWE